MKNFLVGIALTFLCVPLIHLRAQVASDAMQLLEKSGQYYQQVVSYQASATAERSLGDNLTMQMKIQFAYASERMTPPDLPVPMIPQAVLVLSPRFLDATGKSVDLGSRPLPSRFPLWFAFDQIASRLAAAKLIGKDSIHDHPCDIVEVQYDNEISFRNPGGKPVKYWIEAGSARLWKMELSVADDETPNAPIARWTVTWDSWIEDQPPPDWALQGAKQMAGQERPALIGHPAPDVLGKFFDGTPFDLAKLQGRVVVLDFWATWCGPCSEEMASLERLKKSVPEDKVTIVSVTDDDAEKARRWATQRKRTLPIVLAPKNTAFSSYGIDVLPEIVIVDRQGKIAHHWAGMRNEKELLQEIERLSAE